MRYKNTKQIFNTKNQIPDLAGVIGLKYADDATLATHGIYPINEVVLNSDTHKLGEWKIVNGFYEQELIPLTQEEINGFKDAKIPLTIPKLNFKIGLLTEFGISDAQVNSFIETLPNKDAVYLFYNESSFFERKSELLLQFAPAMGLNEDALKLIFTKYETI